MKQIKGSYSLNLHTAQRNLLGYVRILQWDFAWWSRGWGSAPMQGPVCPWSGNRIPRTTTQSLHAAAEDPACYSEDGGSRGATEALAAE